MRRINVKNLRYADKLARERRRSLLGKIFLALAAFCLALAGIGYFLFFAGFLKIKIIAVAGAGDSLKSGIERDLQQFLSVETFGYFPFRQSLLLFDGKAAAAMIKNNYPVVEAVVVSKVYPDGIDVEVKPRESLGVWCRGEDCRYFDKDGVSWGSAIPSSGFLEFSVQDQRAASGSFVDTAMLGPVRTAYESAGRIRLGIKKIVISPDAPDDFKAYTLSSYYLLVSSYSDISGQMELLKILLDSKGADFYPQYIDLRINGRLYYK